MAWRNLWRNARRTWLTVLGMAFGIMLSVVIMGMSSGTYGEMIDYAAHMGAGHISIEHEDYRNVPQAVNHVAVPPEFLVELRATAGVRGVLSRVTAAGLLSTAHGSASASVIGIDTARESPSTMPMLKSVSSTRSAQATLDPGQIWLGATLRENLDVAEGRRVVLTFTDQGGEVVTKLARVSGVLNTGAPSVDGGVALVPISDLQEGLGFDSNEVTYEAILLDDHRDAELIASSINSRLTTPKRALTWYEAQPQLASFIAVDGSTGIIIQFIVLLLLAAGVFNTIFVSVVERRREFGVLRAIGFSRGQIFRLVLAESAWIAVLGLVTGTVLTIGPYLHLSEHGIDISEMIAEGTEVSGVAMQPILKVRIYPIQAARIAVVVVVATLIAGLAPAWSACKRLPAAVLRG